MKLLVVTKFSQVVGGAETYLSRLLPALQRQYDVTLLYEYPVEEGLEPIASPDALKSWCYHTLGLEKTQELLQEWVPDLVYLHGLHSIELESHLIQNYKSVLYAHDYQYTCLSGVKRHSLPQKTNCTKKMSFSCLLHYFPRKCGGNHPLKAIKQYLNVRDKNALLQMADAILVASHHMQEEYQRNTKYPDRVHHVPYPNPLDVTLPPPFPAKKPEQILFLSRLVPAKGGSLLIQAVPLVEAQLNRRLHLLIAGSGSELKNLQAEVRRKKIQATFLGQVDKTHKIQLLKESSLVVIPSLWPEPFGLVGIEAGLFGTPSVGYLTGGIQDWLIPGQTGEGTHEATPKSLAQSIIQALQNPQHYQHLQKNAWENAHKYTFKSHFDTLSKIFENL